MPVFEYRSVVWCSTPESHLKQLVRVDSGYRFLACGVLDGNPANQGSVTVLGMQFNINSNPMHPLSGALPLPYVLARVTRGALVAHLHSFGHPRCRKSQYSGRVCSSHCLVVVSFMNLYLS